MYVLNFLLSQQRSVDHIDVWSPVKKYVCFESKFQCDLHFVEKKLSSLSIAKDLRLFWTKHCSTHF